MLEEAIKIEVQSLLQRQKSELKECKDINSKNRCEAAYKLRLCYNHLKNLEAEQRLREVLERSETGSDSIMHCSVKLYIYYIYYTTNLGS